MGSRELAFLCLMGAILRLFLRSEGEEGEGEGGAALVSPSFALSLWR